ncbi:glycoside hydrolase family 28 protein [Limisphaera sp. VF-2]|uniref:glycoside hydrolase family 28 protein n=1 Tax=Limisphaera sp. VF-2 TaxID=3400418 RepID=UPI001754747A|nr:glycoside hydrolase family 28 protein [Limisphaera sp.]
MQILNRGARRTGALKLLSAWAGVLVWSGCTAPGPRAPQEFSTPEAAWREAARIVARVQPPRFPDRSFSILDFGAVPDGRTDATEAIRRAIAACVAAGGGRVVVPPGEYVTGPIHLRSRVNLHVAEGAVLKFKTDPRAYLPQVLTRFEGMECYNYSPLLYAHGAEHVAVTGRGLLDGQASFENWWAWKGRWKGRPAQGPDQTAARNRLVAQVAAGVPVEQRRYGEGDYLRPNFIQFYRCRNVLIEGVRIRRSPMWVVHPVLSTNVLVRGIEVVSHGPNNDGCNPESCRDVVIEECVFDTGDDCIAIKSGRNEDGRRLGVPSENIVVRKCRMRDGHGGVVIGSEISGGCRNVFVEDCEMDSPNLDRVIRFKSNAVRGGLVENIFVRNLRVGQVADALLQIDFLYEEGAQGPHRPVLRRLRMEQVDVQKAARVLDVRGFEGAEIRDVRLVRCRARGLTREDVVQHAEVHMEECVWERAR